MIDFLRYGKHVTSFLSLIEVTYPWQATAEAPAIVMALMKNLPAEFIVKNNVAIHRDAQIEEHVVMKSPIIIGANCFVGAHAYLRGGVFLDNKVSVGPGCEIKSSFILERSALAHFNFAGDCLIGAGVNMEAGSIIANHYNERENKLIDVLISGKRIATGSQKFGGVVGNNSRIGANAVLSPGTMLEENSIVKRLELIQQL